MSLGVGPSRGCDDLRLVQKAEVDDRGLGADIVVTLPGTSCRVVYSKTADNKLVASTFSAPKVPTEKRGITFAKFLGLAWTAANVEGQGDRLGRVSEGELASRSSCLARGFPA